MYYLCDSSGELTRLGSSADVLRYYRFASEVLIHDHKVKATIMDAYHFFKDHLQMDLVKLKHLPLVDYDDDELPFPDEAPHTFEKWR